MTIEQLRAWAECMGSDLVIEKRSGEYCCFMDGCYLGDLDDAQMELYSDWHKLRTRYERTAAWWAENHPC